MTRSGPKNARTDEDSGVRRYTWRGRELPSNTSLRRLVGLPFTLHNWILTQHIEAAIDVLTRETHEGESVEDIKRLIRKQGTAKRDRAADLGIRIHAATAAGIVPDRAPADERPRLYQYQHWLATSGFTVLLAERQVFNLTLGYAGSFDILGRDADGRIGLLDIKTGDGVYIDHLLQLIGYALGEFIGEDDVIDRAATRLLEQVAFVAVLHLGEKGWELLELDVPKRARLAFRALTILAAFFDHPLDDYVVARTTGAIAVPPLGDDDAHQPTDPD
jgi:hypothetical protein